MFLGAKRSEAREPRCPSEMLRERDARLPDHGVLQWRRFGRLSATEGNTQRGQHPTLRRANRPV